MRKSSCKTLTFERRTSGFAKRNSTPPATSGRIWPLFHQVTEVSLGPGQSLVLTLYYADGMSEPKILELLQTAGNVAQCGTAFCFLIKDQAPFHAEMRQCVQAGLESSPVAAP